MTEEMKQCVLKIHKNKIQPHIRTRTNGKQYILWETKVEGKRKITANTYDILLQKLFDYYSGSLDRRKKPSCKLANLFVRFIKWKSEEDVSGKTLKEYVRLWLKYYAEDPLTQRDITFITAQEWIAFFRNLCVTFRLTRKSFVRARSITTGVISMCLEKGYLEANPLDGVSCNRLPYVKEAPYYSIKAIPFTDTQVEAIKRWAEIQLQNPRIRPLYPLAILFNLHVGLRFAELNGLLWKDVDMDHLCLTVSGQCVLVYEMKQPFEFVSQGRQRIDHMKAYEAPRIIPISDEAASVLIQIKELNLSKKYVFPNGYFRYHTFNEKIKDAAEAGGLNRRDYRTHSLRATAATFVYNNSYDIKQVQLLLGHTTPEMSAKYVKDWRSIDVLRATMNKPRNIK